MAGLLLACGPALAVPMPEQAPAVEAALGTEAQGGGGADSKVVSQTLLPPDVAKAESQPKLTLVNGKAYLVMDADTGKVLISYHGMDRRAPASLTKVMTALLVLERGRMEQVVTIDKDVERLRDTDSTMLWVEPGDTMTVRDLLYGMMLMSGNDAALVLAKHLAGSEANFVELMNKRAAELGLKDTRFSNAHGLDSRNHYSSAHDLARLSSYAMKNQAFRQLSAAQKADIVISGDVYPIRNYNSLLTAYQGTDGIKIGFTDAAGQTIAASATRDGRRLIAIVLGSDRRFNDAINLLDLGFGLRAS